MPIPSVSLPPVSGYHNGTGFQQATRIVVDPSSVPGTAPLAFLTNDVSVTTLFFGRNEDEVPKWFGVAVPPGVTDFTRLNIFFHPSPGQAGYLDSDYFSLAGQWPKLFYYLERLGHQVDAARQMGATPNQIVVMPFLTSAATSTWVLPQRWLSLMTDVLTSTRSMMGKTGDPISVSEVVVSCFSVGYAYLEAFRAGAGDLAPLLSQTWDFDGYPKADSSNLNGSNVLKYDLASEPGSLHLPPSRWTQLGTMPTPPNQDDWAATDDLHHWVIKYMFLHAATKFS